jgi:hypothetical protein
VVRSALALTTAFECLQRDLKNHNAQKKKQVDARKNARRSLQYCGLMSADQGLKMVHTLRDKAARRAVNRSVAAKKAAITRANNARAKLQPAPEEIPTQCVHYQPRTP